MERDGSTASAATSTSTSSTTSPTRASTRSLPWLSMFPLHQTEPHSRPRSLFTSSPPRIREPIPEFSMSRQDSSQESFYPVVFGRVFEHKVDAPFRIREPIPEFSMSQQDASRNLFNPVFSSVRGFKLQNDQLFRVPKTIPEFSMSKKDPSRKNFNPVVSSGRGFMPKADPPLRLLEPIPEFSKSQQDPPQKIFHHVVSSGQGFKQMDPPPPRIRKFVPEFFMPQQDPPQKIFHPVVSSGRGGFMPRAAESVSTDQTVNVASLGMYEAGAVVGSPHRVRPPPLDYLRPSLRKARAATSLHQLQHKSPLESSRLSSAKGVYPSASPKIVPPSSSADCSDSRENRERINLETFAVVRDRKVRITEGASLYSLCRSWFRNGLPAAEYQLPHENYKKILPKPLPPAVASPTRPEEKDDNQEETENDEKEESVDHLAPEDLLKQHIMRSKRVRARLREERYRRISRYKHRINLLLPKLDEQESDSDPNSE